MPQIRPLNFIRILLFVSWIRILNVFHRGIYFRVIYFRGIHVFQGIHIYFSREYTYQRSYIHRNLPDICLFIRQYVYHQNIYISPEYIYFTRIYIFHQIMHSHRNSPNIFLSPLPTIYFCTQSPGKRLKSKFWRWRWRCLFYLPWLQLYS